MEKLQEQTKELNLNEIRSTLEPNQSPYKVVRRDAVQYVGMVEDQERPVSIYNVDGKEIMVSAGASAKLDEVIGLERKQAGIVRNASGETGMRDFRNYLAVAGSMTKPVSVALVANPETCMVDEIIPIKQDLIPLDAFFDLVEVFMAKNKLIPVRYETDRKHGLEVTVYMNNVSPDVRNIGPGEDFLVNSYFMRWNLGQIEVGHYFIRLVCTNGQIRTIRESDARVNSLQDESVIRLIDIPSQKNMLDVSFEEFSDKAVEAMKTRASMRELMKASKLLNENFVAQPVISRIAPFEPMRLRYADRGFDTDPKRLRELKSGVNMWDLYNDMTEYATHNSDWKDNDSRRGYIQREALNLLMSKRDIRQYQDIFAGVDEQ